MTSPAGQQPRGGGPCTDDGKIPLELRIAVTGHRKLASVPALAMAIDGALDLIVDQLRPAVRARCRLVAVSALAEGADRLVADRVLARTGARLEVILPLPQAEYVTDFKTAHSLAEFEALLRQASWVGTISSNRTREEAYAEAGRAVIDRADVAIAVWDGLPAAGKGGTGDIVTYVRRQQRLWVWVSADGAQVKAENLAKLTDGDWPGLTDADLTSLSQFNELMLHPARRVTLIDEFRESILDAAMDDLRPDLAALLSWLQAPFARAELLSRKFQSLYLRLSSMLFVLAALAVCIVGMQLVFFPQIRLVVAGEIACLIVILVGLEWGRRIHLQQRWISTRYLAERLRNAFFLALAGVDEQLSAIEFVGQEIPAAPWVGTAFKMAWMRRPQVDTSKVSVTSLRRFLSRVWVDDQRRYFETASDRAWGRHHFSTRAAEALFALSVIIAIVHIALGGPDGWMKHVVSLLAISIPACAAALVGYNTQREYLRNALRYGRTAKSLADANDLMLAARDYARVRELLPRWTGCSGRSAASGSGTVGLHDLELPV